MAFANFFDRTVTAASQVLSNFNVDTYKATLSGHQIGLCFDESAATSPEGRATLEMCVRILARLYPAIVIAGVLIGLAIPILAAAARPYLAIAIFISAVNALTLSPALCAIFLKDLHSTDEHGKRKGFSARFFAAFNAGLATPI